jgi:hypothetical protein
LHAKLKNSVDLLRLDVDHITEHFCASRFSYSTQALPINVLLDTLIRPNGDTEGEGKKTCVKWEHSPERAVSHIVVGNAPRAGGQWADNPVEASCDIGTLSYGGMLSLPGYSFGDHYERIHGQSLPCYTRPSRRQVADYFSTYPTAVGINDTVRCGETLRGISRTHDGFYIQPHNIYCKHLVLATGIFSELLPPRPLLQPLLSLPKQPLGRDAPPILVVGSGFTAADVIISAPPKQKIIHIFKWAPDTRPSPLRACHQHAYPEYAGVYKRMRLAASAYETRYRIRPRMRRGSSTPFLDSRDWQHVYEGLPNTAIVDVDMHETIAVVTLEGDDGVRFQRKIGGLAYVVGRRGSLNCLDSELKNEVMETDSGFGDMISGQTLRKKVSQSTEVAPNVFITGSLIGDSLVRFSYGGCAFAAGRIMNMTPPPAVNGNGRFSFMKLTKAMNKEIKPAMNGLAGHNDIAKHEGHESSPLDRRKDEERLDLAIAEGKASGWLSRHMLHTIHIDGRRID